MSTSNKIIFTLFLFHFLFTSHVTAQYYQPILEEGTILNYQLLFCDGGDGVILKVKGDTSLNSVGYKKVYRQYCGDTSFYCLVRTDPDFSKLWAYYPLENKERLLMDLDLEIADTFYYDPYSIAEVAIVENIEWIDSNKHIILDKIRWNCSFPNSDNRFRFIEGLGPTQGIFRNYDHFVPVNFQDHLSCVHIQDSLIYQLSMYIGCDIDCFITSTNEFNLDTPAIVIAPNPTSSTIIVSLQNSAGSTEQLLQIFSLTGQLLHQEQVDFRTALNLDVSDLPTGIYFLQLTDEQGRSLAQKFVKE